MSSISRVCDTNEKHIFVGIESSRQRVSERLFALGDGLSLLLSPPDNGAPHR